MYDGRQKSGLEQNRHICVLYLRHKIGMSGWVRKHGI